MSYHVFEDEHYYVCHDGRELRHIQTETKKQDGYTQTFEVYACADCSGCEHKARCLYKFNPEKDADKNKLMKINEQWEDLKAASHANIESEKGILNRQIHPAKRLVFLRGIVYFLMNWKESALADSSFL